MDIQQIKKVLKNITFAPSNLDMGWKWEVEEMVSKKRAGFLIRTTFKRPDTRTGKVGWGYGRWMFVDKDTDERGIVMTAWICAELIVKHELMEAYLYKNARILDPHKSLEELAFPNVLGQPAVSENGTKKRKKDAITA